MNKWDMYIKKHTFSNLELVIQMKKVVVLLSAVWVDKTTDELFNNKKIVLFSLPGAFTPTCSGEELPSYDRMYQDF